jgi:hypothetical protein
MIQAEKPGSRTDKKNRPDMITAMKEIIENKTIIFYQDFIVSNYISNVANIKEEIKDQFKTFSRETIPKNDPEGKDKYRFHGKLKGKNDDFVLAILINIHCAVKIMTDQRYKKLCKIK